MEIDAENQRRQREALSHPDLEGDSCDSIDVVEVSPASPILLPFASHGLQALLITLCVLTTNRNHCGSEIFQFLKNVL